jgi:glycosyltransferase involved in cell wall biosynthesis
MPVLARNAAEANAMRHGRSPLRGTPMRILIVTDAWSPQINGVVTSISYTIRELQQFGHEIGTITPDGFRTVPCPTYPEIRLAIAPGRRVARMLEEFGPDAVHISTEGPLGSAARAYCMRHGRPFTTAYHTQFPEYVHARCRLPVAATYAWMRRFHAPARAVMVGTPDIHARLTGRGFRNLAMWSRGVDTELFHPGDRHERAGQRPIFLYVGRVSVEKNIEAFLSLRLPGTKWVVGDGPARAELERRFPTARFFGMKTGEELAWHYRQADVFVFPSRTDTFGLVLIEAMACGTPVAAYPVSGPIDVVTDPAAGVLDHDLAAAAMAALELDRNAVRRVGQTFSWTRATRQFEANLHPAARTGQIRVAAA